ncbi:histidine kinase [Shewanella mangrovi]|uniref:histidine kinase n=1 Tax=Shewanella mangrovi TaxID=1515746 RepID=A0A094JWZ6_9GAMM|nr:ATP-binding protein [Shewanella mangrovi]KFZ36941.1 histidine kinase [Shewanella mangrovi]
MKRLFISLYLLIVISFLGLGWTLDTLWQQSGVDNTVDEPLHALAAMLKPLGKPERQQLLRNANQGSRYPIQLLDADQIALDDQQSLTPNKIFTTQLNGHQLMQFLRIDQQVLVIGPLEADPRAGLRSLFTLLFYLSLAGVALLWVWPLSRDLKVLRQATQAFGKAKWDTRIQLSPRSQVTSLATTFNEMARHISALIDNQRHLSNAVSHEIRTPLARLKFALALIPRYFDVADNNAAQQQFLEGMQQDVQEMESLLQEMLTYASLESAKTGHNAEPCDLVRLCRQVIERVQPLNSIPIAFETNETTVSYLAESSLIERALQNLLTNAQRFANHHIVVQLTMSNTDVLIAVHDDGEGISKADQQKIFTPFVRSDSERNANKGFGLGLAIISRIMQRHEGAVLLNSEPGHTCFTLQLPLPPTAQQSST